MVKKKISALVLIGVGLISTVFAGGCVPAGDGEEGGGQWTMIIFIVLIFAAMYFLMIRPQRKRQKEHQEMVTELQRGDRVITTGGIYGTIETISEDSVIIKVESGTTVRVARGSISAIREK